jgi:hypothetical protein
MQPSGAAPEQVWGALFASWERSIVAAEEAGGSSVDEQLRPMGELRYAGCRQQLQARRRRAGEQVDATTGALLALLERAPTFCAGLAHAGGAGEAGDGGDQAAAPEGAGGADHIALILRGAAAASLSTRAHALSLLAAIGPHFTRIDQVVGVRGRFFCRLCTRLCLTGMYPS